MRRRVLIWAPCILSFTLGCATHQQIRTRPVLASRSIIAPRAQPAFTTDQNQLASSLCFKGMPQKTSTQLGPTEFIFRRGYVLEHSSEDKIPLWVCEHVTAAQLGTDTDRSDKFKTDPDLKGPHSTPADYSHSGYDQGHQAPAANQGKDQELQDQTFFMSNMAPQRPKMNRNAWKALETLTRQWVTTYTEAYEFTGPIFYDPNAANGVLQYPTIGRDAVAVPTHFYKIVIVKDGTQWKSIAFVMPNVATYKAPYHLEQYIQSIRWIEQHTGLNFMPDLTAQQVQRLEAQPSPMW
jgi:endonuclease G, mitochondrial